MTSTGRGDFLSASATCDYKHSFMDVVVKCRVTYMMHAFLSVRHSRCICKMAQSLPAIKKKKVDHKEPIPVFLLGDPTYLLAPYLMKEYANRVTTAQEQYFGISLCRGRMVIECASGRLKMQFGAFRRPMDINLVDLPCVICLFCAP